MGRSLAPSGHGAPVSSVMPALVICICPGGFCWARLMLVTSPAAPPRPQVTAAGHSQTEAALYLHCVLPHSWAVGDGDKSLHWSISLQTWCICHLALFSSV